MMLAGLDDDDGVVHHDADGQYSRSPGGVEDPCLPTFRRG
jgi:hypothetical protein